MGESASPMGAHGGPWVHPWGPMGGPMGAPTFQYGGTFPHGCTHIISWGNVKSIGEIHGLQGLALGETPWGLSY